MKVSDIRPNKLLKKQAEMLAEDIAGIIKYKKNFIKVACPACSATQSVPAFEKYGFKFVQCKRCLTIYTNPRPTPEMLKKYYRISRNYAYWSKYIFPASENTRKKQIFRPRVQRIARICADKTGSIMDVGAAFGTFCLEVKKLKVFKNIIAVEPTPELAQICRDRGFEVIERAFEDIEIINKVDVVTAFEVLEHIFKPKEFILKARSILKAKGIMAVTCPNGQSFEIAYLKERSDSVDNEHLNLFNPQSLKKLFENCGFDILEVSTPGKLDVELVQNKERPKGFVKLLTDKPAFQQFLADNMLSSHMWLVAQKRAKP